jgi:hypothetical protein
MRTALPIDKHGERHFQCIRRLSVDFAGLPARWLAQRRCDDEMDDSGPLRRTGGLGLDTELGGAAPSGQSQASGSGVVSALGLGRWAWTPEGFCGAQSVSETGGAGPHSPAGAATEPAAGPAAGAAVAGLGGTGAVGHQPGAAAVAASRAGESGESGGGAVGVLPTPLSLSGLARRSAFITPGITSGRSPTGCTARAHPKPERGCSRS